MCQQCCWPVSSCTGMPLQSSIDIVQPTDLKSKQPEPKTAATIENWKCSGDGAPTQSAFYSVFMQIILTVCASDMKLSAIPHTITSCQSCCSLVKLTLLLQTVKYWAVVPLYGIVLWVFRSCKTCQKTLLPVVQLVLLATTVSWFRFCHFRFPVLVDLDILIMCYVGTHQ